MTPFVTPAELRSKMPASTEGGIKISEDLAKYVNEKYEAKFNGFEERIAKLESILGVKRNNSSN